MNTAEKIIERMAAEGSAEKALHSKKFMQAQAGGYGEGDEFLGLTVPQVRALVCPYWKELPHAEIETMLRSKWHEVRMAALVVMQKRMKKETEEIYSLLMSNVAYVNNWDLVDVFTPDILGRYWYENNRTDMLWSFAGSANLWKERIAMLASSYPIRKYGDTEWAVALAEHFIGHSHHLMHKASGWMLREAGKKNEAVLLGFLDNFASRMPRTMLRYSIEKLTPSQKVYYMEN